MIRRNRKFSGSTLAQTLVFGWLAQPQATMEELAEQAGLCGVHVSPQSLQERFTPELAAFMQHLLSAAATEVVVSEPSTLPLLRRFNGVYVNDSTVINLPTEFTAEWPACGGDAGQSNASLKVQVRVDFDQGRLQQVLLEPGRSSDQSSAVQDADLPKGSLRLSDLGYFDLRVLRDLKSRGVYWITRIQPGTKAFTVKGTPIPHLCHWLKRQRRSVVDVPIQLGAQERLPCRLIAVRVPKAIVRKRLERLERDAKRRGRSVSEVQRAWVHWTIYATSVPAKLASWREICVLYRVRWQIEVYQPECPSSARLYQPAA